MRGRILILAAVLTWGTGLARTSDLRGRPSRQSRLRPSLGTVGSLSATPAAISFQASNPDSGVVQGSAPTILSWSVLNGSHLQNWSLSLQAGSNTFAGCPTIPVSAVVASCTAASASGTGGTGSCGLSVPLSTTLQQIAGGAEGDETSSYTVSINFTLAESWRYVANSSCTITLTYSINAQ